MMGRLKLRLDVTHFDDGPKNFEAVANIYPMPSGEKSSPMTAEERKELQGIVIPAGNMWEDDPRFREVPLPPGQYFVEAVLPSEEAVGEEVLVTDAPDPEELRLRSEGSPHEWLSWQRVSGNVPAPEQYFAQLDQKTGDTIPFMEAHVLKSDSPALDEALDFDQKEETRRLSQGYFFSNSELLESIQSNQIAYFPGWLDLDPPARISQLSQPYASDMGSEVHPLDSETIRAVLNDDETDGGYRQDRFERYYLFTHGQDFPDQYSVLPIPWDMDGPGGEKTIQVMVQKAAESGLDGLDQGFRISSVVQDENFGSMVGYLGAGRLTAADSIFSQARDLLFRKYDNPMAAAAGAYVLLGNRKTDEPDYWHGWIRNLMRRFPWLPDGAILYGRLLLGLSREEAELEEARASFLEGARRGLPYFSKGVVYLLDGLTRFKNDAERKDKTDQEVDEAHKLIQVLALRTNMRQPFTTVLLD
jgi:hypothetical protein